VHGGRLELDCPEGRGCIFRLWLPLMNGSAAGDSRLQ
jgi:hypothetical protein